MHIEILALRHQRAVLQAAAPLGLASFQDLHAPKQGCIATHQRFENVSLLLASFSGMTGTSGTLGTVDDTGKPLEKQKIAVS